MFTGGNINGESDAIKATALLVQQLAQELEVSGEAIVLAWLMRHPAAVQPVIGTTNVQRIRSCQGAEHIELSREQWYQLYVSARGRMLP